MQRARILLIGAISCAMLALTFTNGASTAQANTASETAEKKVNVKVITTENGESETVDKILSLESDMSIESILREMGVIDEFGQISEDEVVEITVRRKRNQTTVSDMTVELEPAPGPRIIQRPAVTGTGFLGVNIEDVKTSDANSPAVLQGVKIRSVIENTGAAASDLQAGDIVQSVNGIQVKNVGELVKTIRSLKPQTEIAIEYVRDGVTANTSAVLGGRSAYLRNQRIEASQRADALRRTRAQGPFLGVGLMPAEDGGSVINSIFPNSTAKNMGLLKGDKVISINGQSVAERGALGRVLRSAAPVGEAVTIEFERDGEIQSASGVMQSRAESGRTSRSHRFNREQLREIESAAAELEVASEELEQVAREMKKLRITMPAVQGQEIMQEAEVIREVQVRIALLDLNQDDANVLGRQTGLSREDLNQLAVQDLSLYPNPSDGRFQLKFDLPGDGLSTVKIFDVKGNEIYAETMSGVDGNYERTIDISDKTNGAYFLQVTRNGKSYTKKLVVE